MLLLVSVNHCFGFRVSAESIAMPWCKARRPCGAALISPRPLRGARALLSRPPARHGRERVEPGAGVERLEAWDGAGQAGGRAGGVAARDGDAAVPLRGAGEGRWRRGGRVQGRDTRSCEAAGADVAPAGGICVMSSQTSDHVPGRDVAPGEMSSQTWAREMCGAASAVCFLWSEAGGCCCAAADLHV